MKVKGVIIGGLVEKDVKKILPKARWDYEYDELNYRDSDKFYNELYWRSEALDSITTKYFCGSDDGESFWFSDCQEGINAIIKIFPEFEIVEVEREDYPMDYDYKRDKK